MDPDFFLCSFVYSVRNYEHLPYHSSRSYFIIAALRSFLDTFCDFKQMRECYGTDMRSLLTGSRLVGTLETCGYIQTRRAKIFPGPAKVDIYSLSLSQIQRQ